MEDFELVFPLWMACRIDPQEQSIEYACTVTNDGESSVAVFTEELHVERFIQESAGCQDMIIKRVRDNADFIVILERVSHDYRTISIDPRFGYDPKATTTNIREYLDG